MSVSAPTNQVVRAWVAASRRGSILIFSYFVVAMLLGLAIPQTMRSMTSVRLEQRYVDHRQLWHATEAGVDEAIRALYSTPEFGSPLGSEVPTCPGGGWDCWPSTTVLPGMTRTIRARNTSICLGFEIRGGRFVCRKEIRVETTSQQTGDRDGQALMVEVRQPQSGAAIGMNSVTLGPNSRYHGWMRVFGDGQTLKLQNGAKAYGKMLVGYNGQSMAQTDANVCCDSGDAIYIENAGGAGIWELNDADSDGTPEEHLADSTGRIADWTGPQAPNNPNHPNWWSLIKPTVEPIDPCSNPVAVPDVIVGQAWTFCPSDTPDNPADNTELCDNGGLFNGRIGQPAGGTEPVLYCVTSLNLKNNSTAQFMGNELGRAEVIGMGEVSGSGFAFQLGPDSKMYSFKKNTTPSAPNPNAPPDLYMHVPKGNSHGVKLYHGSTFYGGIDSPEAPVVLGVDSDVFVSLNGPLIGQTITLSNSAQVQVQSGDARPAQTAESVKILAWRHCLKSDCSQ